MPAEGGGVSVFLCQCGDEMRMSFSRLGPHGYRVRRRICDSCGAKSSTVELPDNLAALALDGRDLREAIINSPETRDFMAAVPLEAIHQRERWGSAHDAGKTAFDWFWLVGYLAQKAAAAAVGGDREKALHHTISTAAALANWHAALSGSNNQMRPGIDDPELAQSTTLGQTP